MPRRTARDHAGRAVSDASMPGPAPPLPMTPEKALDAAGLLKAMAGRLAELGEEEFARLALRRSEQWAAYAAELAGKSAPELPPLAA